MLPPLYDDPTLCPHVWGPAVNDLALTCAVFSCEESDLGTVRQCWACGLVRCSDHLNETPSDMDKNE